MERVVVSTMLVAILAVACIPLCAVAQSTTPLDPSTTPFDAMSNIPSSSAQPTPLPTGPMFDSPIFSSIPPTTSFAPSHTPSSPPASYPTISPKPSPLPTISELPSVYPSPAPSFFPSTGIALAIQKNGMQLLEVDPVEFFDSFQIQAYQRIMETYTENFGDMVGRPFIVTTCNVTDQELATTGEAGKLILDFTIRFESKFGHDVEDYPSLFQDYMNNNLKEVTARMQYAFLDNVVAARRVQLFQAESSSFSPTPEGSVTSLSPTFLSTNISISPSETATLPKPTSSPTNSFAPSYIPSSPPTSYPTISHKPSPIPTISALPSVYPSPAPSVPPSTTIPLAIQKDGLQLLQVDPVEFFDSFEVEAYQRIMQSYTADFGDMVGPPFIVTIYNVTDQELATTGEAGKLILDFTIRFESKYGYDVEDYPSLFLDYINNNLEEVTARMQSGFLENVVEAKKVQLFQEESSSISPSPEGGISSLFPSSNVGAVSLPPSKATLLPKPSPWPSISDYPTISSKPSPLPSISDIPSAYPSTVPSFSPSTTIPLAIQKNGIQLLEVNLDELFDSFEIEAYQRIMQSYTEYFGEMIGPPFIFTTCNVTDQEIATNGTTKKLVVDFTIRFESKYGYDVDDYPSLFQDYMNNHLEEVTARMQYGFLDNVVAARRVQLFRAQNPTNSPEEIVPSLSPSSIFVTSSPLPSEPPSVLDEGGDPSLSPSRTPATYSPSTDLDNGGIVSSRAKWTIGLLLGVTGSALVVLFIFYKMSRRNRLKDSSTILANSNEHDGRHPDEHNAPEFTDVSIETVVQEATTKKVNNDNKSNTAIEQGSDRYDQNFRSIPSDNMENDSTSNYDTESVNAAAIHESKLESSKSVETRDNAVESMRTSIVESVRGSDPMMSLAMVAALMDDVEAGNDMLWGESLDAESIEAECLWEVHSWIRKNDRLSSDERNEFFQSILDKMVATVRRGIICANDGTTAIHSCATMLGLPLEKELPINTVIVTCLRKTNNLPDGRFHLVEAFKQFGDIESAAIASSNRGFGFVRFSQPKSVARAFEKVRVSQVDVQDTSIMIKTLQDYQEYSVS